MTAQDFSMMVISQRDSLNAYAHYLTKDYNDAQDLTQDTIMRALIKRDKFSIGSNARAWLCTIMKNTFVNNYRKNKRTVVADTSAATNAIWHSNSSYSYDTLSRIRVKDIAKNLSELSDHYRIPIQLYYKGYHYREIAELTGQPIGTIKSRIHSAKKILSKAMDH
jgi:RNA polymerase sigma factor (sigma-70 family)